MKPAYHYSTAAVVWKCSVQKVFLEILQNSLENTCARIFFNKVKAACSFITKETPAQVFSCKSCEVFKNTYLEELK